MAAFTTILHNQLSYLHNIRLPVNRLPPEIFRQVLLYLEDRLTPLPNPDPDSNLCVSPSLGSWHRASRVCRRWRQGVFYTRELWTTIKVSDNSEATHRWATTWLTHSGALPLHVLFKTGLNRSSDRTSQADISRIMGARHRISGLYFYGAVDFDPLREIVTKVADRLETMWVYADPRSILELDDPPRDLPRLQVLSVANNPIWQAWSIRGLRHLSLMSQTWEVKDVKAFFAVLEANTRLEELMLRKVGLFRDAWADVVPWRGRRSPISLPSLKRLYIEEQQDYTHHVMIEVLDRMLTLPSSCTRFYVLPSGCPLDDSERGAIYPVERLAITGEYLIGTDETSTCVIDARNQADARLRSINRSQVHELWIRLPLEPSRSGDYDAPSPQLEMIRGLPNVTKLVIQGNVSAWLDALRHSLPALRELHLLVQHHYDYISILQFLAWRQYNGSQLDTLRFVGDPGSSPYSEEFGAWKENPAEFEELTNRVIFEEVSLPQTKQFEYLVSERLGIPEVCKHPSPTSMVWQPWNTYVQSH